MANRWQQATTYIQGFTQPRHAQLEELLGECRPSAGYGRQDEVLDAALFLVDYVDNHMRHMRIPQDYATPASAIEALNTFVANAASREEQLAAIVEAQINTNGSAAWNATELLSQMREYRRAAEHAISLFEPAEKGSPVSEKRDEVDLTKDGTKAPKPNWANKVSAIVGLAVAAAAAIFWAAGLQYQVVDLEKRLKKLEEQPRQDATTKRADTCHELAMQVAQLRRFGQGLDAEEVEKFMVRMKCEPPAG